jgi:hypothetical protein
MKTIEQIKSMLPKVESEGEDGFRGYYSTCGKTFVYQFSWGENWEHLSVSLAKRTPTWEETCMFKEIFWQDDEVVMQLHSAKKNYINRHNYCLHLWRPVSKEIPLPPIAFI